MTTIAETAPVSKPALWMGRLLSGLVILFLLFDGAVKLVPWPIVTESMEILLTGYLGGAMASHLRIGSPLFTHILFGFYLGLMVWGGLWLRDRNLRALLPFRR